MRYRWQWHVRYIHSFQQYMIRSLVIFAVTVIYNAFNIMYKHIYIYIHIYILGLLWHRELDSIVVTDSMMTSSNGNISAVLALCAGVHRSPVNSPNKGQWRGALMFPLILNKWLSKQFQAGDLRRHRAHHDVIFVYQVCSHAVVFWEMRRCFNDFFFLQWKNVNVVVIIQCNIYNFEMNLFMDRKRHSIVYQQM